MGQTAVTKSQMGIKKALAIARAFSIFLGDDRIRTGDKGFADPCLTTWPRRHKQEWQANDCLPLVRAGDGIRTRGLLLGKETFYH